MVSPRIEDGGLGWIRCGPAIRATSATTGWWGGSVKVAWGRCSSAVPPGGRPVAVKLIRYEYAHSERFRARFAREVEAARKAGGFWTRKRAARIVAGVRTKLSGTVPGLMEDEIPQPVGNALNHNLITELLVTTTLVKSNLALLEGAGLH